MKKLTINSRFFGVEVETSTELSKMTKILKQSHLLPKDTVFCNNDDGKQETDGVKYFLMVDTSTESELVTPKLTLKSPEYENFKNIVKYLKEHNVDITDRDGLHIHLDISDINPDQVLIAWLYFENKIKKLFPKIRIKDSVRCFSIPYMKKKVSATIYSIFKRIKKDDIHTDHHSACSFFSYDKNKDIEIRFMEGTLDIRSIDAWIKFCMYFLQFAKTMNSIDYIQKMPCDSNMSVKDLCAELKIKDPELKNWLKNREILHELSL